MPPQPTHCTGRRHERLGAGEHLWLYGAEGALARGTLTAAPVSSKSVRRLARRPVRPEEIGMGRALLVIWLLGFSMGGCVSVPQGQYIDGSPTDYEFRIEAPRSEVFESLLSVAQSLNLSVDVLEKESGFIQFEHSALSAPQLDEYCSYPAVKPGTTVAWDTFVGWNQRSMKGGGGSVSGTVSLSVVLTDAGDGGATHAKLHSTWVASNRTETQQVTSKGVLERQFEDALRSKLGLSPEAP